jgi:hypothetical protein
MPIKQKGLRAQTMETYAKTTFVLQETVSIRTNQRTRTAGIAGYALLALAWIRPSQVARNANQGLIATVVQIPGIATTTGCVLLAQEDIVTAPAVA